MAKTLASDFQTTETKEDAELKAGVRQCIAELEAANGRMAQRQLRINKLKLETRAMLNDAQAN